MDFCLIRHYADEFKKRLKNGEINPVKMNVLSTEKRQKFFETFMDKDGAQKTNLLFEQKIVQKNQVNGAIRWAEQVLGVTDKQREKLLETIRKNNEERLRRTFNPTENEAFLNDLVNQKLGIGVTREESHMIFKLSEKIQDGAELFKKSGIYGKLQEIKGVLNQEEEKVVDDLLVKLEGKQEEKELLSKSIQKVKRYLEGENPTDDARKRIGELIDSIVKSRTEKTNDYGIAKVALKDYIGQIKLGIKEPTSLGSIITDIAGFTKSVLSSIDNSFI